MSRHYELLSSTGDVPDQHSPMFDNLNDETVNSEPPALSRRLPSDDGETISDSKAETIQGPSQVAAREPSSYLRFLSRKQSSNLIKEQSARWVITVFLVASTIATLRIYQSKGFFSESEKRIFNFIVLALNLMLAINFLEALKTMARILRWRILADNAHTPREVDLILGGESLTKLITLAWESRRTKPARIIVCSIWVGLNLLAQASIATLGVTYSPDDGFNSKGTIQSPGIVTAANLSCFYSNGVCPDPPEQYFTAHLYGDTSVARQSCEYSDLTDISKDQSCYYYRKHDLSEFAYRYSEYNPRDTSRAYPLLTDRIITASSSNCSQYNIADNTGDGTKEAIMYQNGTGGLFNLDLATGHQATAYTTYIYPGSAQPQYEANYSCGARCIRMRAFQASGVIRGTNIEPVLYECSISVGNVSNVSTSDQQISDGIARVAASAIGLDGTFDVNTGSFKGAQLYSDSSHWSLANSGSNITGARMAEFAIGTLAVMANLNPQINMTGHVPKLGTHLRVHWHWVIVLAVSISGVHLLLFVWVVYLAEPIIAVDNSFLAAARLLHPLVKHLDTSTTVLDGKSIADKVEESVPKAVYGFEKAEVSDQHVLSIGDSQSIHPRRHHERHPDGVYV